MNTTTGLTGTLPHALGEQFAGLPATVYSFRIDADGVPSFPFVSPACAELYGFTSEEAMANVSLMHEAVHPDDRQRFDDEGQHSLRTLEPFRWEGRILRADGIERSVVISSQPLRMPDGATEWVGVVVEHDQPPSSSAASEREAEISHVQADAIGMLGHDVAAPLTTIRIRAELALEKLDLADHGSAAEVDTDEIRSCLETILRQVQRLDDIRGDLLAVAAAEADTIQASPSTVDVLPFFRAVADVSPSDVTFRIDCAPEVSCTVQPSHLTQMLSNLVSNAVRYADRNVTLSATRAGDRVLIMVEDDGPGVAADVTARLFWRFTHAGLARRPRGAGSGLGLYIVRTLATANGGTVLYSPGDSGSRFTLALPAAGS